MKFLTTLAVVATALTIGVTGVAAQPDGYQPQLQQPTRPDGYQPQLGVGASPSPSIATRSTSRPRSSAALRPRIRTRGPCARASSRRPSRSRTTAPASAGGAAPSARSARGSSSRSPSSPPPRRAGASPRAPLSQEAKRRLFRTCPGTDPGTRPFQAGREGATREGGGGGCPFTPARRGEPAVA